MTAQHFSFHGCQEKQMHSIWLARQRDGGLSVQENGESSRWAARYSPVTPLASPAAFGEVPVVAKLKAVRQAKEEQARVVSSSEYKLTNQPHDIFFVYGFVDSPLLTALSREIARTIWRNREYWRAPVFLAEREESIRHSLSIPCRLWADAASFVETIPSLYHVSTSACCSFFGMFVFIIPFSLVFFVHFCEVQVYPAMGV